MVTLESLIAAKLRSDNDRDAGDTQPLLSRGPDRDDARNTPVWTESNWASISASEQ